MPCYAIGHPLGKMSRQSLRQMAEGLGIAPHDLLLVADGIGTDYARSYCWACIEYDRSEKKAFVHLGGESTGRSNIGGLYPFLHALTSFDESRSGEARDRTIRVAVVSNSELMVQCGNEQPERRDNDCFWASIAWFERRGYEFEWYHLRRWHKPWNGFGAIPT